MQEKELIQNIFTLIFAAAEFLQKMCVYLNVFAKKRAHLLNDDCDVPHRIYHTKETTLCAFLLYIISIIRAGLYHYHSFSALYKWFCVELAAKRFDCAGYNYIEKTRALK